MFEKGFPVRKAKMKTLFYFCILTHTQTQLQGAYR